MTFDVTIVLVRGHHEPGPYRMLLLLLLSRVSRVRLCATPQTAAHQAPLSLGFSRQEPRSGWPFPSLPWTRPIQDSEQINVCILTAIPTSCSPLSLPLLRPPYSLRHNNFKLDQLISLQWPLNVQMKGPISHFKSKATNLIRTSKQNSLIADTEKDLEVWMEDQTLH